MTTNHLPSIRTHTSRVGRFKCRFWTLDGMCVTPTALASWWCSIATLRPAHMPASRRILVCNSSRLRRGEVHLITTRNLTITL